MIEQALLEHLQVQCALCPFLARYAGQMAIFNQEAPADQDLLWEYGSQYGRIVFAVDIQGDPERTMGGTLAVDIMCKKDEQVPEEIEPIVRSLIHGYFFSNGIFTVAAQFKNSSYFTQADDEVIGCTIAFDLLAFPIITTAAPDVISRFNEWTKARFPDLHVINLDKLPTAAWKPSDGDSAIYWRLVQEVPSKRARDNFHTIWRDATVKGHIFSVDNATMADVGKHIIVRLYADKRMFKDGESPLMVNWNNTIVFGADPLRSGQVTVEATYGEIVYRKTDAVIQHINTSERSST